MLALGIIFGFIAVLAGWMVTEVGRQPWVVYGVLKTRDAWWLMGLYSVTFGGFVGLAASLPSGCGFLADLPPGGLTAAGRRSPAAAWTIRRC